LMATVNVIIINTNVIIINTILRTTFDGKRYYITTTNYSTTIYDYVPNVSPFLLLHMGGSSFLLHY
jgi:hypothetical protein